MRLESLRLKDIGPFDDTTIEFPKGVNDQLADVYLLVGQNGCGKTTALEAIASVLMPPFELGGFRNRATSAHAQVMLGTSAGPFGAVARGAVPDFGPVQVIGSGQRFSFLIPDNGPGPERDGWLVWSRNAKGPVTEAVERCSWSAFAYAAVQPTHDVQVSSISEMSDNPLNGALSFGANASTQRLAQWVVLQDYRIGKTTDAQRKTALRQNLNLLEGTVAEIIGTPFGFVVPETRLTPQALVGGQVLEFGQLPLGLQAIINWLGDLLMRLDRLPWVGDLPPSQREFLLLLDEIDLHLHPAWQRKILPAVQKLFPKAQVIASTHSPFVVASLRDGAVIELSVDAKGRSSAKPPLKTWDRNGASVPHSYSAVLSRLFGIESDFDPEEEREIRAIQELAQRVMGGEADSLVQLENRVQELQGRGDEYLAQLVEFELRQALASLKR